MDKFGFLLSKWQKKSPLMKGVISSLVIEYFHELMKEKWGDKIEEQARALHVKNNILTVACISSVIASEIRLNETDFINRINQKFGIEIVKKIKYML